MNSIFVRFEVFTAVAIKNAVFVSRTIQLWNQLPEDALRALSCKPNSFRKTVRKVINKAK
jgi:hypothetical protein